LPAKVPHLTADRQKTAALASAAKVPHLTADRQKIAALASAWAGKRSPAHTVILVGLSCAGPQASDRRQTENSRDPST
jgi:hypothetical protein